MANLLKIKSLCSERKIGIGALAQKVDLTSQAMHSLIRNGSTNTSTLEKIAEVLNVPVSVFFDDGLDFKENSTLLKIISEKDAQIAEKDRQIAEKDAQIKRLFDLLEKK